MSVYGNTCPMCCGDLDDLAYLKKGAPACPSCGANTGATVSPSRQPDRIASGVSAIMGLSQAQDIEMPTSAGIALQELSTG